LVNSDEKKYPERTIAVVLARGGAVRISDSVPSLMLTSKISPGLLKLPILFAIGEKDSHMEEAIELPKKVFERYGKAGASWAIAEEPDTGHETADTGHETADTRLLAIPFFDAMLHERLRARDGKLNPVDATQGWLGNLTTHAIVPLKESKGNPLEAVWLPNEETSRKWKSYVTPLTLLFLIGFRDIEDISSLELQFERYKKQAPTVRDIVSPLGLAGSENNQRICNAKVTIAANPVMRRSPYAGMLFNGQGRPLNPVGYSCALHASMGGNKTPIIDEEHCYFGQDSWVEWYHSYLMKGGKPLSLDAAPKRLRRLTIDEALRIQTFPHDYQFIGGQSSIYRQIGNAVPCDLAQVVAEVVRDFLGNPGIITPPPLMEHEDNQLRLAI
jgi:hypothetical protein